MNRTRKWDFVAQEARRLVALGLNANQIANRLGLNRSTVTRWMKAGKLSATADGVMGASGLTTARAPMTPPEWAATVRQTYQLDATDDQLVTIAESALALSLDASVSPTVRMAAGGRFASLVKQLALKAPIEKPSEAPEPERRPAVVRPIRGGLDPRAALQAVQ